MLRLSRMGMGLGMTTSLGAAGDGGSEPAGHLYWRFVCTQTNGSGTFAISELEFLDTGGNVLAGTGAPIYSTQLDGNTPQHGAVNAFDGNKASGAYASNGAMPQYIGRQFASPVNVAAVRITSRSSADASQAPRNGYCQYSDNGTDWTTAFDLWEFTGWGNFESRTTYDPLQVSGSGYLFWRVNVTANNGSLVLLINELEFRETSGGADVTSAAGAVASSVLDGNYLPSKAFDNTIGTGDNNSWAGANGQTTGWIAQKLATLRAITEIVMWARDSSFDQMPRDFSIQRTNYPVSGTWVSEWSVTNQTGWTSLQSRTFTKP